MNVVLLSPAGLWALLGIPVVLLIHFIQQRYKRETISTLFLLGEQTEALAVTRRIDWIRNSRQLWLQLLAVVLIALLLSQPRIPRQNSTQRVVVVLDSSFSMLASRGDLINGLEQISNKLEKKSTATNWVLLETVRGSEVLYEGTDREEFLRALAGWVPSIGEHPVESRLEEIERLYGRSGQLVFVSDHVQDTPPSYSRLGFGTQIRNWGISGFYINKDEGRAEFKGVIKNYSEKPGVRRWQIASAGDVILEGIARLEPGSFTTISAALPSMRQRYIASVENDEFTLDDTIPFVVPQKREIHAYLQRGPLSPRLRKVLKSLPAVKRVSRREEADVSLEMFRDSLGDSKSPTISFYKSEEEPVRTNYLTPERRSITEGLRWGGLWVSNLYTAEPDPDDYVLVWAGSHPAIYLRGGDRHLVINFDVSTSNALQHPAFILLLHRFLERNRSSARGFASANLELSQSLRSYFSEKNAEDLLVRHETFSGEVLDLEKLFRAPSTPGFLTIKEGADKTFEGAVYFGAGSESDFRENSRFQLDPESTKANQRSELTLVSVETFLFLSLILILLLSWAVVSSSFKTSTLMEKISAS